MIFDKELTIGIFNNCRKTKKFTISWNSGLNTITAYQPGDPISQNDFDRPRINTFRTDSTNIVYTSAGFVVWDPVTKANYTPWGDRSSGSINVNIPVYGSLSAGVDFFTDARLPSPVLTPTITQWLCSGTGNPNEIKYQYIVDRNSLNDYNININFSGNTPPVPLTLLNMLVAGSNLEGEIALGSTSSVTSFTSITARTVKVVCGLNHTLMLSGATLFVTGGGGSGQLGLGTISNRTSFTQVTGSWVDIAAGVGTSFALSGDVWYATGENTDGQLGLGHNDDVTTFTPLPGKWNKIAGGGFHTFALSGKQLFATGQNSFGQLGLGNGQSVNIFTPLTGKWDDVTCGSIHTVALSGGHVFTTGNNDYGQLGNEAVPSNLSAFQPVFAFGSSPTVWPNNGRATGIRTHPNGIYTYILSSGITYAAGSNSVGQLALNSLITIRPYFTRSVAVSPHTNPIFDDIVCGGSHVFAKSGSMWFRTGNNLYGQLGTGGGDPGDNLLFTDNFTPAALVACGNNHTIIANY